MAIRSVCLLLGRDRLWDWLVEALERLEAETEASVDLVVRTDTDGVEPAAGLDHPFDAPTRYVAPEADGQRVRLPEDAVADIAAETDVVVQNGVGILTGAILTEPEYGVLSYHHGDIRRYRGVLTHFWNYVNRDASGGVTLLSLDESLDGGGIAAEREVDLSDCYTWREVERRKQRAGVPLLADAVERFEDPSFEPTVLPEAELGRLYDSSDLTPWVLLRYVALETYLSLYVRATNVRTLRRLARD